MHYHFPTALNAVSDVVQNRPVPLREFDQIYMKAGDVFLHVEYLSKVLDKKELIVVGDGDGVALTLAHLKHKKILEGGPSRIVVLDFDERMVNSINEFAQKRDYEDISAELYNVIDPMPEHHLGKFDAFHINPPWGQYNDGASVKLFYDRGSLALRENGLGVVVIGQSQTASWTGAVLKSVQAHAIDRGAFVEQMLPDFHHYHLDDAPDLTSCLLVFRHLSLTSAKNTVPDAEILTNFYGRDQNLTTRYVRVQGEYLAGAEDPTRYWIEAI